jgi:hypothetical protein
VSFAIVAGIVFGVCWAFKKAGYIRNKEMAEYASKTNAICIAFPVGESKGTRMMMKLAHEHNIEVIYGRISNSST